MGRLRGGREPTKPPKCIVQSCRRSSLATESVQLRGGAFFGAAARRPNLVRRAPLLRGKMENEFPTWTDEAFSLIVCFAAVQTKAAPSCTARRRSRPSGSNTSAKAISNGGSTGSQSNSSQMRMASAGSGQSFAAARHFSTKLGSKSLGWRKHAVGSKAPWKKSAAKALQNARQHEEVASACRASTGRSEC